MEKSIARLPIRVTVALTHKTAHVTFLSLRIVFNRMLFAIQR